MPTTTPAPNPGGLSPHQLNCAAIVKACFDTGSRSKAGHVAWARAHGYPTFTGADFDNGWQTFKRYMQLHWAGARRSAVYASFPVNRYGWTMSVADIVAYKVGRFASIMSQTTTVLLQTNAEAGAFAGTTEGVAMQNMCVQMGQSIQNLAMGLRLMSTMPGGYRATAHINRGKRSLIGTGFGWAIP